MFIDRALVAAALPGYQLAGDLGKGGFGLVLAGQHKLIGRKVAIKILLDTSEDIGLRERFLSEARVLAELDHPHIVRIHDYVEYQGICLLVMELLSGGTLKARIAAVPISLETTCAIGLAASSALANAHSQGVLHRDVKPDNMMFAGDGLLKVTDFGIAKIFDGAETTASAILGTPRYMAPEQIMGSRMFPATDLYALAGVLYEIFAGRPLFGRPMAVQPLTHHHLNVAPDRLTSVPEPVASVVMRSLAKNPAARHVDAADFALDLARAATQVFGAGWLQRSEIKVRLDDEVHEAALGTSTTPMRHTGGRGGSAGGYPDGSGYAPIPYPDTEPPPPTHRPAPKAGPQWSGNELGTISPREDSHIDSPGKRRMNRLMDAFARTLRPLRYRPDVRFEDGIAAVYQPGMWSPSGEPSSGHAERANMLNLELPPRIVDNRRVYDMHPSARSVPVRLVPRTASSARQKYDGHPPMRSTPIRYDQI